MANGFRDQMTGSGQRSNSNSSVQGPTPSSSASMGSDSRHCLRSLLNRHEYSSSETEAIYRSHTYPAEFNSLRSLAVLMIALNVSISAVNFVSVSRVSMENMSSVVLCLLFVVFLILLHTHFMSSRHLSTASFVIVLLCLAFAAFSFPVDYQVNRKSSPPPPPAEGVWRLAYVIFVIYAFVPLRIYVALIVGFLLPLAHSLTSIFVATGSSPTMLLWRQITANIIIFLTVNIIGLFCYDRNEKLRRRLFGAIRDSVTEQLRLQETNEKMDRLLLCILPPHVATEMRSDLRRPHLREIFPKAYIQRHDCVSIFIAEILGLSSISSQCSVHELIRLLNELFGRFDQLALENHCVRIQMMGDSYFGVCGLPDPRPDHAKCCIEMGLDMIDVITFIREATETSVHLRVGVHTGRVISGVVGLRRWKYDVWSDDVELAQHTLLAGLPDRIHVTQVTVDHLQGEFPTEPGHGDERSVHLKNKAINTYLVVTDHQRKRYGPLSTTTSAVGVGQRPSVRLSIKSISNLIAAVSFNVDLPFANIVENNKTSKKVHSVDNREQPLQPRYGVLTLSNEVQIQKNLTEIINSKSAEKTKRQMINYVTLCFKSASKERKYRRQEDRSYPTTVLCSLVLLVLSMAVQAVILPRTLLLMVLFVVGFAWISVLLIIILGYRIRCVRYDLRKHPLHRLIFSLISISFLFTLSFTNAMCCRRGLLFPDDGSSVGHEMVMSFNNDYLLDCDMPHYIYLAAIVTLMVVALFLKMTSVVKLVIWLVIAAFYIVVIEFFDRPLFKEIDAKLNPEVATDVSGVLMFLHFLLALYIVSRDIEWTQRLRFLWSHQVSQQQNDLRDVHEANRLLVLNILPDHVTTQLQDIGTRNITELYSQSHSQVAVCFLSIVNLTDLSSLLDGTNKLDCLRVLNDVISAIDKLMDDDRHKAVCKVKSFGTSFLSAVGLQASSKADDTEDWRCRQHVSVLVDFIFDAMETVAQRDGSLMLRAGLSIGPVVAGVVGAKKPQYDIWGETVNLASKLEKTGLPNCIQVTQKIQELLQMKYEFHSRGNFKLSGKPGITTYFLPGRNSSSRPFIPSQQHPQQQHLLNSRNSFRLLNPSSSSAAKQSESSYEFTSSSSAVSSGRECQQPSVELPAHKPPPSLHPKDNAFQVGKVYMTPPSSLGRRRSILDDPSSNGQRKTANRPPLGAFQILTAPVGAALTEEDMSPDLPTVHYRNITGPSGGVGVTNDCSGEKSVLLTQSQILNNPPNGLALHRQISDLSTRSQITPPSSLVNASVGQKRSSGRSSASDSCPGSRKQSIGEINRHQDLTTRNASPSKGSSGSSSQGPPSSRASVSSRPNTQRGQPVNGFENNPMEGRRLSKMEMDGIDEIMKEFTTDGERKTETGSEGNVAIFKPPNHYIQQNQLLHQQQVQQQQQQQQTQLQQLQQHMQHQLLAQRLFQPPANNICGGRPASLLGMLSTPIIQKMITNPQNGCYNGDRGLLPVDEVLQPPVTATVAALVKCAPRVSLAHQMYATPELTNWTTKEKAAVPQKALLIGSLYPNHSKDVLVRRFSPPPLPPPGPAAHAPMFARAKYLASVNAGAAPPSLMPRMLVPANGCLQPPLQPASRPVSLYSAIGGGGRPGGLNAGAQLFRPLGPSYRKTYSSRGGHGTPSSSNHPRRAQGVGPTTPLRHARSLENIGSDADDRRSNNSRPGSPSRPDGLLRVKGQGLVPPDNLSLSSYSGSEVSRSDPTLGYDSGSAIESEYDNYRPGMGSDEDYFVLEPISDIDLDMFDDINVDNVEVSENYNCSYIPMLQKMITDV